MRVIILMFTLMNIFVILFVLTALKTSPRLNLELPYPLLTSPNMARGSTLSDDEKEQIVGVCRKGFPYRAVGKKMSPQRSYSVVRNCYTRYTYCAWLKQWLLCIRSRKRLTKASILWQTKKHLIEWPNRFSFCILGMNFRQGPPQIISSIHNSITLI